MTNGTPISIRFDRLTCISETSERGSDDPYVLLLACNLAPLLADTVVQITNTFSMGEGDTRRQGSGVGENRRSLRSIWPLSGQGTAALDDPARVLIMVALIESDGGPLTAFSVAATVQALLYGSILAYDFAGLSRASLVRRVSEDIRGAVKIGAAAALPFGEDECLGVAEFPLTPARLARARSTGFTDYVTLGRGPFGQGSHYRVYLRAGPS